MKAATISKTIKGMAAQDGAGVKLSRVIGQPGLPNLDPFLMLDEFGSESSADYLPGFPPHPHRGFQTVTYMLNGKMRHRDSVGNDGVIESGGIQWMNAGRGIIHEEMPEQQEGLLRGFQLWVNLPAKDKMSAPDYQDIPADEVPQWHDENGLEVRLLSGEMSGCKGPVKALHSDAQTPFFADFRSSDSVTKALSLNESFQYFIYVYEGKLSIGEQTLVKGTLGVLSPADTLDIAVHQQGAAWILVGGKPIEEPIVQYGPFVMNTRAEIEQAIRDYQNNQLVSV
ncbi:pirin family protein [Alteromonas facilis]|uniref:pirin family protein n=1 Tax=Alteromonas facilis TaxID=2048004 RepID=UPI000C2860F4|nr:pirin family protein [Alteromonas facilis]